jgi:hypothetical protein
MLNDWLTFEEKFYSPAIPRQQKIVIRAKETVSITPTVSHFIVWYIRSPPTWQQVVQGQL